MYAALVGGDKTSLGNNWYPPHVAKAQSRLASLWSEDPRPMAEWEMPSAVRNESFIRWVGRLQRMSCSPKDFIEQLESVIALDAGDAPERSMLRRRASRAA
jgi:hypothetical protein